MNKLIMICIGSSFIVACNHKIETKESVDYIVNNDTITINNSSTILKKLKTQKVNTCVYPFELTTAGKVKAIPNNYALIAAPFAGRITKSYVRLGQFVNAGAPIFEISSPDYFETGKAYYQSKEEMYLAKKNLKRQRDLLNKGVGIQKDLEEAEVNYAIKRKDFENALASLKVFQVDTSDLVLGQALIVRSPIKGRIVENNIVIGLYIKEDSEPVATVAELSKIWVTGQVKEKDIRYINDIEEVEVKLVSFPEKIIKGKIYYINSIIDEDTRSAQVLIECDNKDRIMRPGMYVTSKFTYNISNTIVIPSKSVLQMDDASYVFVSIGKNKYLKQKIEVLTEEKNSVIVKSGLKQGDEIIVNGGFYLFKQ